MEEPSKINAEIGLQQKNSIIQAWTDFKDSIFNVLFVILDKKSEDEEEESLVRLAIESGLDYLQIMAFPFHQVVIDGWYGGESLSGLAHFFKQFSIGSYLPGAPFGAFLVMLYGLIMIILLIIADIVYVSYSFSKKKFRFTFPLVVLAQVVPLFVTVLFLPITQVLLNVVECKQTELGYVMTSFPTVLCFQGWHLFHASVTLLFVFIFVIISSVVALALFEPRMTVGKLTARQNSNGQVVFILNKIVLLFLLIFRPVDGSAFYVVMLFLLSFWQFWCYAVKQPYYSKTATKFFKVCSTYYFWTALMLLVGQLLGPYGFDGALVIWISGLPFFAVIVYFESASEAGGALAGVVKFKSGEQLESHVSYVLQLVGSQATDKNSYMLLIGYIEKHKEVCNETDCPLKNSDKKKRKTDDNMEQSCQQVLKQLDRMMRAGVKKFPECTKLRMSYAFFQLEHLKNKDKAYEEFTSASRLDPSFQQQFNIYRFKKIIRENLQSREGSDADLVETIRFENYVSLLEEAMLLSAKLHKEFWTQLKEEVPDLRKLNLVGAQITESCNAIADNYAELIRINASHCEVLFSYAHYLILVSEDYAEGRELLATARKIFQDRQSGHRPDDLHLEEQSLDHLTAPVMVLTTPSSPGAPPRIRNINLMFTEVTGYQREELVEREVTNVAAKLFQRQGVTPVELGGATEEERDGFLNHKFNHLLSVRYSIAHHDGEWTVIFKLSSASSMRLILLVNQQGEITDSNLLAQTAFRQAQAQAAAQGRPFSLADLGLTHFTEPQFQKINGAVAAVRVAGRTGECQVQVQPLTALVYTPCAEGEDEEERMIEPVKHDMGFKVSLSRNDNAHFSDSDASSQVGRMEGQLDNGVLQLYESPHVIDLFISNLAETKQIEDGPPRFVLTDKIKTMRLLNNEIKMVYAQAGQGEWSDAAGAGSGDDQRELFKFDDEGYQAKLRAAINTNLNHEEVVSLRRVSLAFLLILFVLNGLQLYFQSNQVDAVSDFLDQGTARANEYSLLTRNIMATIDTTANYTALVTAGSSRNVSFFSTVDVSLEMENNMTIVRNLKDAVVLLTSRLISYFKSPSTTAALASLFRNYVSYIYPAFLNYPASVQVGLGIQAGLVGAVGALALLMMGYWIYIGLRIDKKRYDIMIWFLDIPVPYVAHLGTHCDKYLKEFATVKELTQRGIPLEEDEDAFEEYSNKKSGNQEQEIEEQIKARKSLISKNKKETLISKVDIGSLKVLWLLVYASCYSILMLVLASRFNDDYTFLLPQWQQTSQAIIVDNTLYLVLQMQANNISTGSNLQTLATTLQLDHKGVITDNNLESFNYNILSFHLTDVANIYNSVYFSNLCLVLSLPATNLTQCQSLVGSKLKSGYEVYSKYLITPETNMNKQIWLANQLYVVPSLLQMLQIWENSIASQGTSLVNLCTIMLYVFVIVSILAFLLVWLYYLRKLNTELNQTIQMLNMIPFKLLPKSRKETKLFIAWIIREANKTKHQDE